MPDLKYGLQYNLNRIANLLVNDIPTLDAQGAANVWAGTTGLDLLGALNYKAGTFGLGLNAVCNALAGTVGLDADAASASFSSVSSLLASAAFYISADGATANRQKILNQGSAGSLLDVTVGSTAGSGLQVVPAESYIYLPGVGSNYLSVPDANDLDITGDIDVRFKVALDDWTPSVVNAIGGKWDFGTKASWILWIGTNGVPTFVFTQDGSTPIFINASTPFTFADGETAWIRVTFDADNGTSKYEGRFYTSTDGSTWTQFGTTQIGASVGSIYSSDAPVRIGSQAGYYLKGKVYRAQVFNGIEGVKVLDVSCADASTQRNTFQALTGQTVTINESGADSNDPKFLEWTDTNYVYIPVATNNAVITGSITAFNADLDLRAKVALDDWTPATDQRIFGNNAGDPNRWVNLVIATTGNIKLQWYPTGSNASFKEAVSTVVPTVADGQALWIRATLDVDNGSSGYDVKFYTSDNGSTWTQLGSTVTVAGVTSLNASTASYGFAASGATDGIKFYNLRVMQGINGTDWLNIDTSVITSGAATSFTALTGQTVTINRATSGRKTTVVKRPVWLFGTDDYMSVNNRWVRDDNDKYIKLPGVAGNYLSVPDSAALDITGDIDIRVYAALDDWTPSADGTLLSKYISTTNQRSYALRINGTGVPSFFFSSLGTLGIQVDGPVAPTVADGQATWIRVTLDVDNGAGGYAVKFYQSADGVTWNQLGVTVTAAGTTSIYASTSPVEIGSINAGTAWNLAGKVYKAQIFNGIDGTKVLDIDTSLATPAVSTFTAVTGQTVTINGSSVDVVNGNSVYLPGVIANYLTVPDSAALDVVGDIDVRVRVAMDDWTPAAFQYLIGKWSSSGTQSSFGLRISVSGYPEFLWTTDGATPIVKTSTAPVALVDGTAKWIRATLDVDNGAAGNTLTFYMSDNGTVWTQLGSAITTAGVTSIFNSTAPVEVGSLGNGNVGIAAGRFLRAQIFNGINGTKVLDVDPNVLTSVSQTTFTERSSNAATVTINKSGTGYVSTPVLTSGYIYPTGTPNLTASSTDHLNFGATDSFTVVAVGRTWTTFVNTGQMISKFNNSVSGPGWLFGNNGNSTPIQLILQDVNIVQTAPISPSRTSGNLFVATGVVNRSTQQATAYLDSVAGTVTSSASVGSAANTHPVRIGNVSNNSLYNDIELFAVAVFRRALTTDEIATLNTYFQGIAA